MFPLGPVCSPVPRSKPFGRRSHQALSHRAGRCDRQHEPFAIVLGMPALDAQLCGLGGGGNQLDPKRSIGGKRLVVAVVGARALKALNRGLRGPARGDGSPPAC